MSADADRRLQTLVVHLAAVQKQAALDCATFVHMGDLIQLKGGDVIPADANVSKPA